MIAHFVPPSRPGRTDVPGRGARVAESLRAGVDGVVRCVVVEVVGVASLTVRAVEAEAPERAGVVAAAGLGPPLEGRPPPGEPGAPPEGPRPEGPEPGMVDPPPALGSLSLLPLVADAVLPRTWRRSELVELTPPAIRVAA